MKVQISIPEEANFFSALLTLPMIEDNRRNWRLKGPFTMLRGIPSVTLSLNDVVLASLRYLYIVGGDDASITNLLDGWVDTLRWHIASFWDVWHDKNCVATKSLRDGAYFAGDHAKFSGEMIAQGFAVKVFELLGYGQQNMYFYPSGNRASPDFVVIDPSQPVSTAVIARDGKRYALEARCRAHNFAFKRGERAALSRKKKDFAGVLAIYFIHAEPYERKYRVGGVERTRLLLLDPEGEALETSKELPFKVAIRHYIEVCRRIGLWSETEILTEMLKNVADVVHSDQSDTLAPPIMRDGVNLAPRAGILRRKVGGSIYHGRDFNKLLVDKASMSVADLKARISSRDFGRVRFYGLLEEVVIAIRSRDYERLVASRIPEGGSDLGTAYGADGTVFMDQNPNEPELDYFVNQFQNEIDARDQHERESSS